jgi:hypothetical protein
MKDQSVADRLTALAGRMADDIESAAIIRRGADELRTLRNGFEGVVRLATDRKMKLDVLTDRHDTLRDLIEVIRLEVEDGRGDIDATSVVRDFTRVLEGEDLRDLTAVSV